MRSDDILRMGEVWERIARTSGATGTVRRRRGSWSVAIIFIFLVIHLVNCHSSSTKSFADEPLLAFTDQEKIENVIENNDGQRIQEHYTTSALPPSDADKTSSETSQHETTKSLEQNLEDYYNSVDIEFEQLNNEDLLNLLINENKLDGNNWNSDGTTPKYYSKTTKPLTDTFSDWVYDDTTKKIDKRDADGYENDFDKEESSTDEDGFEKIIYFRDTFLDRVMEDMRAKQPKKGTEKDKHQHKRDVNNGDKEEKANFINRDREITGDTVLHLRSEISDVIKSETDLKGSLENGRFVTQKPKSDSYVDDIMIHPSKFIQDTTPFGDDTPADYSERKGKKRDSDMNKTSKNPKDNLLRQEVKGGIVNVSDGEGFQSDSPRWINPYHEKTEGTEVAETEEEHKFEDEEVLVGLESRKVLECKLPPDVTTVTWFKDGEEIKVSPQGRQYELMQGRHLVLTRVGREHAGRWVCAPVPAPGPPLQDRPIITLIVMEPPSLPYLEVFGRRLDAGNVFLPAREGSELRLACHVEGGLPRPALRWEPDGLPLDERYVEGEGVSSSLARLVVRRSHHNTSLSCVATHPALPAPVAASTLLHVQYAPRFGISRTPGFGFPLQEGAPVSLRCEVDSNPPAVPRWRKDEGEPPVAQSDDGFLNFSAVRREHSGWYKCSAAHPLGNFSSIGYFLNVRYEVDATVQSSYQHTVAGSRAEVALGGAVQLQCPPGAVGCWSRDSAPPGVAGGPVGLLQRERGSGGGSGTGGGGYRCAGLPGAEASRLHTLREHALTSAEGRGVVVSPQNASVRVVERQPVLLESEYCASPPPSRVLWLAAGRALPLPATHGRIVTDNYTNSTSLDCYIARLRISESVVSDSGEYSLVVRGARGVGEGVFHLTVGGSTARHTTLPASSAPGRSGARHSPLFSLLACLLEWMLCRTFIG